VADFCRKVMEWLPLKLEWLQPKLNMHRLTLLMWWTAPAPGIEVP